MNGRYGVAVYVTLKHTIIVSIWFVRTRIIGRKYSAQKVAPAVGSKSSVYLIPVFLDINRKHADITETSKNSVRTYGFRSEPSLLVSVFKEDSCKYAFSVTYSLSFFVGPPRADRCFPKFPFSRGCLGLQHR